MTKKQPLISIIMPAYNAERYLHQAVDSILRQTYTNWELIIVDDGSQDKTWLIAKGYARKDKRIIVKQQQNQGVVMAANLAASMANGEYITRHDSDDISFDTKLEDFIKTLEKNPDAIVVTGSIEVISEKSEFLYKDFVPTTDRDIKRSLHLRNPIPNGATLIKKSAFDKVGGYSNVFAEDCDLWVKLYQQGQFVGTKTFVYRWRTNSKGLTMSNGEKTMEKEKEYVDKIWEMETPSYVKRSDIISHCNKLIKPTSDANNINYKKAYLYDLARLSIHLIKRGYTAQGIKQLLAVASTGRTGLKTTLHRLWLATTGRLHFSK